MKRILDRSFVYVPAVETDLRKTFARVRRQLKEQEANSRPGRHGADQPKVAAIGGGKR